MMFKRHKLALGPHARRLKTLDQGEDTRGNAAGAAEVTHQKPNLPTKICPACKRPFAWRKKWEKVWDQVRYCSNACKKQPKQ